MDNLQYRTTRLIPSDLTQVDASSLNLLLTKLHGESFKHLTFEEYRELLSDKNLYVTVVRLKGEGFSRAIVGIGTISYVPMLDKRKCEINYVVVADHHEHKGLATAIVTGLLKVAVDTYQSYYVTLTSLDEREEVVLIYEMLGFVRLEPTNKFELRL